KSGERVVFDASTGDLRQLGGGLPFLALRLDAEAHPVSRQRPATALEALFSAGLTQGLCVLVQAERLGCLDQLPALELLRHALGAGPLVGLAWQPLATV